ncbi:MAG: cytochrome c [Alphaproteobacteria bacterium]|nr:cytochrome c [Alphaproteobacteria bacterium]
MRILLLLPLLLFATPAAAQTGDADNGEKVFKRYCMTCHIAAEKGPSRQGPTLHGLIGRKSGSVAGFRYSEANKKANIVWDAAILEKYLAEPRVVIPGTSMAFAGVRKADERADLIAYLATLK